ncbi:hypothetical protein [Streptomyces sp. NPDC002550]
MPVAVPLGWPELDEPGLTAKWWTIAAIGDRLGHALCRGRSLAPARRRLAALHDGGRSRLDCRGDPQRRDPDHRRLRTATPTAHPARHGQQRPDGRPIRVRHARRAVLLPGPVVGSVCEPVGQAVTRQGDGAEPSGRRRGTLRHRGLPLEGHVTRSERQQIRRTEGAAPCRNTGPRTTT